MSIINYKIADHCFAVQGNELVAALSRFGSFEPYVTQSGDVKFAVVQCTNEIPEMVALHYEVEHEGCDIRFGVTANGYLLMMRHIAHTDKWLALWCDRDSKELCVRGDMNELMLPFAMWIAYGLMTVLSSTVALHCSCIVCNGKAVAFLGESGTGKSTHTRLWREYIDGAELLNDDSPIIRCIDGNVWAYGSAWSGKMPCYRTERYPLVAMVRLSQANENGIRKLGVLQSYAALHPSCPPEFAYDERLCSAIGDTIAKILSVVPIYHLECLPDEAAVRLSYKTIFGDD